MRLDVSDLSCARGGRAVFENLSFSLEAGACLLVRGANGTGKSSLLRILAGLDAADRGDMRRSGEALLPTACHYVAHSDAVKPAMTVEEHLRFYASLLAACEPERQRLESALEVFDLGGLRRSPARYLSAGQKRRLALCRLVLVERPLWLLDEPTSVLDEASVGRFKTVIAAHRATGGIIILTTHEALAIPHAQTLTLAAS